MKKIYRSFSILSFVTSVSAFAQPAINLNPPKIGDSIVVAAYTYTTSQSADPGTAGSGKSWDFSSITANSETSVSVYEPTTGKPGASNFPGAEFAIKAFSTTAPNTFSYSYGKSIVNGAETMGLYIPSSQAGSITQKYSDLMTQKFPADFNATFTDPYAGTQESSTYGMMFNISGNVNYKYDAHGSLKYAYGTFSNVARVYYTTSMNYAGAGLFIGQSLVSSSENYAFIDLTGKQMLMAIVKETSGGQATNRVLLYKPTTATGLGDELAYGSDLNIYPNPCSEKVTVNSIFKSVSVKDLQGNTLKNVDLGMSNEVITSDLKEGVYLAELMTSKDEKKVVKLAVKR